MPDRSRHRFVAAATLALTFIVSGHSDAQALRVDRSAEIAAAVAEASARFAVPVPWIERVMQVESAGRITARSQAGAIGLMQVMPATYANLRARYGLGADPWLPRDNIMAGTAYLRELYGRYGAPGFLAAYNAGPRRWEEHLNGLRPLPRETVGYLARLGSLVPEPQPPVQIIEQSEAQSTGMVDTIFVQSSAQSCGSIADQNDGNSAARHVTNKVFVRTSAREGEQ